MPPEESPEEGDRSKERSPNASGADDWASRRETLSQRLAEQRRNMPATEQSGRSNGMSGLAEGLKIASEFIGGIVVGAGIGWGIDKLAGTSPFGLIFFLLIGFAAGVLNVIRGVSASTTPRDGGKP